MVTSQEWRELGDEFGRIPSSPSNPLWATRHPPQLVEVFDWSPLGEPLREHRWWTISGGPAGAVEAFIAVAAAAGRAAGAPDYFWQQWLDFLGDASLGSIRHDGFLLRIEEDLSVMS